MAGILATLDWPAATTWGAFAYATGLAALVQTAGYIQQGYYRWRLDRRLARDPYILREELNEYLREIGGDLPPIEPARLAGASVLAGALYAIPVWLAEHHLEDWWDYAVIAAAGLAMAYSFWRRLNDPRDVPAEGGFPEVSIPRDAVLGFVFAIVVVAIILVAVLALF